MSIFSKSKIITTGPEANASDIASNAVHLKEQTLDEFKTLIEQFFVERPYLEEMFLRINGIPVTIKPFSAYSEWCECSTLSNIVFKGENQN